MKLRSRLGPHSVSRPKGSWRGHPARFWSSLAALVAPLALLVAACGDSTSPAPPPPAQLVFARDTATLLVDSTLALSITALDDAGNEIKGLTISWSSSDLTVAAVDRDGLVTALAAGAADITASFAHTEATAKITVWPQVATFDLGRGDMTMVPGGVARIDVTIVDDKGALVLTPAVTWESSAPDVAEVGQSGAVLAHKEGVADLTAAAYGQSRSLRVDVTLIQLASVAVGGNAACGLTPDGQAFCWGSYPLGDGLRSPSLVPVEVAGGHRFTRLAAGSQHMCGVTTDGEAYCWGSGDWGQLGHGEVVDSSLVPVRVASNQRFLDIAGGIQHTCAAIDGGPALCWGSDENGQLGDGEPYDGVPVARPTPQPVVGGPSFVQVTASQNHTCGLTANGEAYCWGYNRYGQLGGGVQGEVYSSPIAAVAAERFKLIAAGTHDYTCGVTVSDAPLCWGHNDLAQLGRGMTSSYELAPAAPVGLSAVATIDGDAGHACAVATDGSGHCWGTYTASSGTLGDGLFTGSTTPVLVAGGLTFRAIDASTGGATTCGVTTDDRAYCWGWNFLFGGAKESVGTPRAVPGQL